MLLLKLFGFLANLYLSFFCLFGPTLPVGPRRYAKRDCGCGSRYADRILVFDAPPLLPSTESGVLASQMGQLVMVVEAERTPQQTEDASEASQPDVQRCQIHKVDMLRRWSKRTQGHYFGHKTPDGGFCYGRAKA